MGSEVWYFFSKHFNISIVMIPLYQYGDKGRFSKDNRVFTLSTTLIL